MRNILFLILAMFPIMLFTACSGNKPKESSEMTPMQREVYIDSLVNVASGLDGVTLKENRKNALKILRKEYPTFNDKWDRMDECINNMELYSE